MIVGEFCRLCEIFSKLINEAHVLDFFVKFVGEKNVYKLKLLIGGTEVHIESIILAVNLRSQWVLIFEILIVCNIL